MNYRVSISEMLQKEVNVEADDNVEAICKVKKMYDNSDVILTADDFKEVTINIMEENDDN